MEGKRIDFGGELKLVPVREHRRIGDGGKRKNKERTVAAGTEEGSRQRFNRRGLGRDCVVSRMERNDPTRFKIHPILFPEVAPGDDQLWMLKIQLHGIYGCRRTAYLLS